MFPVSGSLLADAFPSSIGSRRVRFPDVTGTMKALRLPARASPVAYWFRFRSPRGSSSVRVSPLPALPRGWRCDPGQDLCSAGDPLPPCSSLDVSGTSQVPRQSFPCLCPVQDPGRIAGPSPITVSSMPPLHHRRRRLRRLSFGATAGLQHLLSTLHECCCRRPCKTRFRPAGWPLPGGS